MELVIQYTLQVLEEYPSSVQSRTVIQMRHKQVLQPEGVKGPIIIEGKLNQLYTEGM